MHWCSGKGTGPAVSPPAADPGGEALGASKRVPRSRSSYFLIGSLATGNVIAMVLRMVAGLVTGRLVAPATLGLFNGIGLVLGYAPFLQLGALNGLNRELPYYIGKGDRKRAEELTSVAQAWALTCGLVVFAALTGVAGWELAHGEMWKAAGWFTNGILGFLLFFSEHYLEATFRTTHDFARLAAIYVMEAVAGLVLLVLVAYMNFYGLCLRVVVVTAFSTALFYYWRPLRVGPKWNLAHLKHLLKIGAPIFISGEIFAYWAVVDSTLVLKYTGTTGMGLYSIVLLATSALQLIPQAVSQVLYPRLAEHYGRSESIDALIRMSWKPIALTAVGLVPVIAVAWVVLRPLMHILLPAYVKAVPAMYWSLLLPFLGAFQPANVIFNVARKQRLYATAIIIGIAVYGASLVVLTRGGVSLVDFPQAMLIGRAAFIAVCYLFIWRLRAKHMEVT